MKIFQEVCDSFHHTQIQVQNGRDKNLVITFTVS